MAEHLKSYSNTLIIRRHYQWAVGTKQDEKIYVHGEERRICRWHNRTAGELRLMRVIDSSEMLSWVRWKLWKTRGFGWVDEYFILTEDFISYY